MSKIAFVFPGQGSQCVGMGKDLYEHYPEAGEVFDSADRILGFSLSELCFHGPEEELRLTRNTQPALFTTSVACLRILEKEGVTPEVVAGHSIGEYAALVAARALTFEDGLPLVRFRGELMQEAGIERPGAMAAVLGLTAEQVREICEKAGSEGVVDVANYNSPGQVVISGEAKAVDAASALAKEAGAKRVMPLNVSGAFHSRLMATAAERMSERLAGTPFADALIPVIANVTAGYVKTADEIRYALARQIAGSVRWEESVTLMANDGVDVFVEVGSGKVLSGLIKRMAGEASTHSVGDSDSLREFVSGVRDA